METTGFIHSPGSLISRVMLIEELKEFVSASGLAEAIYIAMIEPLAAWLVQEAASLRRPLSNLVSRLSVPA